MKTLLATILLTAATTSVALADGEPAAPCTQPCAAQPAVQPAALPAPTAVQTLPVAAQPAAQPTLTDSTDEDTGWHRPAGQRFTSGFRLGWMYLSNFDAQNRVVDNQAKSFKDQYGLKSPNMFVIGYEGFYRIVGHSWLNVLMVGNVSVAGLDQSKFIPTASGLLGFEIQRQVELGVGVNLVPDPQAPSHMIMALGWTPKIGAIQTPIHFFYIPDAATPTVATDASGNQMMDANGHPLMTGPSKGNSRIGATIGMNW